MLLAEGQLALGPLGRAPVSDTPLQGAQHALAEASGMAAVEFFEQAGYPDVRHGLQEGPAFPVRPARANRDSTADR